MSAEPGAMALAIAMPLPIAPSNHLPREFSPHSVGDRPAVMQRVAARSSADCVAELMLTGVTCDALLPALAGAGVLTAALYWSFHFFCASCTRATDFADGCW